jgi:multidrug efflux system membrane fusion protein
MHLQKPPAAPRARRLAAVVPALLLAGLAGLGLGCKGEPHGFPPAPVTLAKAVAKDAPFALNAIGTVKGADSVQVKSRVDGHILKIHFKDGDPVKPGDLLFTIDPTTYRLTQAQAQATVLKNRATADQAAKDYDRYKQLVEQGVVSREEFENKLTALATARQSVAADQANAAVAGQNVKFASVTSPIEGRAGNALLDVGNLVSAAKDVLVVVNKIRPADVEFALPDRALADIKRYSANATLTVLAAPTGFENEPERGRLTFYDNRIDPATGMFTLKARFGNESERLWPGQFVGVSLVLTTLKSVIQVPSTAVQTGPQGKFVFVVQEGKAVVRPVVPGIQVDGFTVIEQGLAAGESVVVDGQLRLFPGAPVFEVPSAQASPQQAQQAGEAQKADAPAQDAAK